MAHLAEESILRRIGALEDIVRKMDLDYTRGHAALVGLERAVAALRLQEANRHAGLVSPANERDPSRRAVEKICIRKTLADFPDELLRAIFLCAQDGINDTWSDSTDLSSDWYWSGRQETPRDCTYATEDASLPFVLSAVNRHWRNLVLNIPDLWSFVGVPSVNGANGAATLAYVHLVVSRSQNQGLDIVLAWSNLKWEDSTYYRPILEAVGLQTHRWQRVSLTIPSNTPVDAIQFLRLPMPLLENLTIAPHSVLHYLCPSIATPSYLPHCPRLRRLRNNFIIEPIWRVQWKLTFLDFSACYSRPSAFWQTLQHLPALQHLNAYLSVYGREDPGGNNAQAATGPSVRLALPHLRSLSLQGYYFVLQPWLEKLDMPNLEHVCVTDLDCLGAMGELLANVAATVRTVTVLRFNNDDAAYLHTLAPLRELRHLVLRDFWQTGPGLVRALPATAALLPRLERVSFENGELDSAQAAHLADLLHVMHANAESGGAEVSLTASPEHVPEWLLRQYEYLQLTRKKRAPRERWVG